MYCLRCGHKGMKLLKEKGRHFICPKCNLSFHQNPAPTVTAIILQDRHVLFTKRSIDPKKGFWDLPGGFVAWGEHPETALRRELKEELGVRIKSPKFLGIFRGGQYIYQGKQVSSVVLYYTIKTVIGKFIADKKEIAGIRWFPLHKLPKRIAFDNDRKALNLLRKPQIPNYKSQTKSKSR